MFGTRVPRLSWSSVYNETLRDIFDWLPIKMFRGEIFFGEKKRKRKKLNHLLKGGSEKDLSEVSFNSDISLIVPLSVMCSSS